MAFAGVAIPAADLLLESTGVTTEDFSNEMLNVGIASLELGQEMLAEIKAKYRAGEPLTDDERWLVFMASAGGFAATGGSAMLSWVKTMKLPRFRRLMAERGRGNGNTGDPEQPEPTGDGQALAGHGGIGANLDGSLPVTKVPEGTNLTIITGPGQGLSDIAGQLLEAGKIEDAIAHQLRYNPSSITGAQSFLGGSEVPNYVLLPPYNPKLGVLSGSTIVQSPTPLSDLLIGNMGCVNWAACTKIYGN